MTNSRLRGKAIRHNWTITQILDEAAIEEESNAQTSEIDRHLQDKTRKIYFSLKWVTYLHLEIQYNIT